MRIACAFAITLILSGVLSCHPGSEENSETEEDSKKTFEELIQQMREEDDELAFRAQAFQSFQEAKQAKLEELRPQAESGDPEAQHQLGKHYDFGWGVQQDGHAAARWYKSAAEQGHVEAQTALGALYSGTHMRNDREALRWYKAAAENGGAYAQKMLGDYYKNGALVPRNYAEAAKWYLRSIEGGYFMAPHHLARLYEQGLGVPRDIVPAYAWNSLTAATGNNLARGYQDKLEARMAPDQINHAQKRAQQRNLSMSLRHPIVEFNVDPPLSMPG